MGSEAFDREGAAIRAFGAPLMAACLLLSACGSEDATAKQQSGLAPDFHLTDVNTASKRYDQSVSPRDYLGQISVWYFGHST